MSIESPAEKIWQYAMHADSINRDADDASLNVGDGRSGGDATIDFSGQLGSIPSKLSFHGLAQSQTQSQGARPLQAPSVDDLESQKENRQLPVPMGPPWPVISGTAMTATSRTEHVSTSTTGASPRVATPFAGPVTAPSNLVPLMAKQGDAIRASPMSQKAKAVSFSSPNTPPSPPTLPRTLTMPPRLNRYAPRNIDRSSQDSFAGPLPPQDLNSYVRNTAIFNNIYISRGRDGRPGEVFEHPSHVSDTTTSLSEPPPVDEINTPSQSEHRDDGPSVSQVMRAAFPSLSPMSAPDPVILARDSQSQDSQGGSGGNDSNIGSNHNSGGAISSNSHASNSQSSHFFPHASSSSSISYVPQDDVSDSTQTNTQATQPSTQPPQTDPQHITTVPSISSYPGLSLLPVPPHRRREVASLQAARLQAKAEVIPETPASTAGLSVQASAAPSLSTPAVVDSPQIQPQRSTVAHLMGKERIFENREVHTKPSSKGKGRAEQVDAPAPSVTAWATR
ncbi:hypothetical protein JB92DRAFT_1760694 [Gautieria morchelliformis]|nr:hypothetical protein JB92DRAFT_1760694 [Gautieria morchelliformis]